MSKRKPASRRSQKSRPAPAGLRKPVVFGVIAAAVGGGLIVLQVVLMLLHLWGGENPPLADHGTPKQPPAAEAVAANSAPAQPASPSTPVVTEQPQSRPAAPTDPPPPHQPPRVVDAISRVPLPGRATDMLVGGGGRYLVIRMADEKIHVFDLARREFTAQIPVRSRTRPALAASRRHLFLVDSSRQEVRRLDLPSGANERQVGYATLASIDSPAIGSDSDGPLVVRVRRGGIAPEGNRYELQAIDPETLYADPIRLYNPERATFVDDTAYPPHVCASPDGRTICTWRSSGSPTGLRRFQLSDDFQSAEVRYEHVSVRYARPDRSGRLIFASNAVYDGALQRLDTVNDCVPVGAGQLYLKRLSRSGKPDVWALCRAGANAPLAELPDLKISRLDEPSVHAGGVRGDMRVSVLLQYQCVVSISPSREELVIYRFDLADVLDRSDTELIVALSVPPTQARPGDVLTYRIEAVSGGTDELTYALDYGPPGMSLTPRGELTWPVPADFGGQEASVIIAIETPSGTRDYQSFVLHSG